MLSSPSSLRSDTTRTSNFHLRDILTPTTLEALKDLVLDNKCVKCITDRQSCVGLSTIRLGALRLSHLRCTCSNYRKFLISSYPTGAKVRTCQQSPNHLEARVTNLERFNRTNQYDHVGNINDINCSRGRFNMSSNVLLRPSCRLSSRISRRPALRVYREQYFHQSNFTTFQHQARRPGHTCLVVHTDNDLLASVVPS